MEPILFVPIILSFFVSLLSIPYWIKKTKKVGLVWEDMNKPSRPKIPGSGGVIVVMGFVLGVLSYIAIKIFVLKTDTTIVQIFALLAAVLISALVAFTDDIFGWQHGGLSVKLRLLLIFLAAVPLMVINAGYSTIAIPFMGEVSLGLLYPLLIIPIGIIGATTTFNFLAGYNGLEAGQGILLLGAFSIVAFLTGNSWLTLIGLCMIASLAAFLIFNKFPAQVFPGDVLTYSTGILLAIFAILGNFEKIAVFFFIPYILETVLKVRGKLKKQSFGKPKKDESLDLPYKKIYGLEHLAILMLKKIKRNGKVYEKDVVYFVHFIQITVVILGLIIFKNNLVVK